MEWKWLNLYISAKIILVSIPVMKGVVADYLSIGLLTFILY